jgi:LCP family protein required for cell wall assembly
MSITTTPISRSLSSTQSILGQYVGQREMPDGALKDLKPKKRRSIKKLLKRAIISVLIIALIIGGFLGWKIYNDASKVTGDKNPLQLLGLFKSVPLNETNGRVDILLAGYSVDDPDHQGAELTDSIMVVSIDPQTKAATLISIPRDLYVDIPGFGYQKINAAYEDGQQENFDQSGYDSGGMGLLELVINQDLGIKTDYYGILDYTAFKNAVNAVGGVTVDIESPDANGLYDPNADLNLPNGEVSLNGQEALNLARARGDGPGAYGFPDGDFDRTEHQQQLLIALKDKASSAGVISNPIKVAKLADAIGNNFKTNMSLGVMETLYKDTKGISDSNINSVTFNAYNGQDLLTDYYTQSGQDALVPAAGIDDYSQIQAAVQTLIGSSSSNN